MPSQIEDDAMDEPKKVLGVTFHIARPDVGSPAASQEASRFSSAVGVSSTSILGRSLSIPTMWNDEFNALES